MEQTINQLLRLNLEIEGALWVVKTRRSEEAKRLLKEKADEFQALLATIPVEPEIPQTEAPAEPESKQTEVPLWHGISISEETPSESPTPASIVVEEPEVLPEPEPEPEPEIIPEPEIQAPVPQPQEEKEEEELLPAEPELRIVEIEEPEDTAPEIPATEEPAPELPTPAAAPIPVQPEPQRDYRIEDMISRRSAHGDLSKAFTLNDKFRFIRGIFCDDKNDFEYTLAQLSEFESLDQVYDYLLNELGWDIDNEEVKDFISIVANHFNDI